MDYLMKLGKGVVIVVVVIVLLGVNYVVVVDLFLLGVYWFVEGVYCEVELLLLVQGEFYQDCFEYVVFDVVWVCYVLVVCDDVVGLNMLVFFFDVVGVYGDMLGCCICQVYVFLDWNDYIIVWLFCCIVIGVDDVCVVLMDDGFMISYENVKCYVGVIWVFVVCVLMVEEVGICVIVDVCVCEVYGSMINQYEVIYYYDWFVFFVLYVYCDFLFVLCLVLMFVFV